jgi:hypothetical protein
MATDPEPEPSTAGNEITGDAKPARPCSCTQNPFAGLPPELQPKPKPSAGGLRHATCPGCGLIYWTNRATDLCLECAKSAKPEPSQEGGA